ncbi:MAG: substrate-binding domain-containing protein [Micropruina sp.]|nr:substrate-binding domain-containing protein [Micropruina sp.]
MASQTAQSGPNDRDHAATIYTVAERAGVSHQTVSRYLKGESLRPRNRERVEQALDALDYRVNDDARALATKKSRRIGAFVFDLDDWAPQRVLAGAAEAARSAGYILDILRVDPEDAPSVEDALRLMNTTTLAGVVVISPSDPVLARLQLHRLKVPWVVEAEPELLAGDDWALDHPFAHVVAHLADLGHRRFFHIGGPRTWLAARNRLNAYREVLARRGLHNCGETAGDWGAAAGYEAMASYPHGEAPTALVAASDQLALGVLFWLQEHGVRVPEDVSVSGYDGIVDTAYYWPPLTTAAVDFARLGRNTVQALLGHEGLGRRPDLGMPVAQLIPRASTGRPGGGIPG